MLTTPISIIIITLNEAERIGNILTDLCQQTYQHFEVIVVDSNSDDATCAIAQHFVTRLPTLTIHQMDQRGVSLGRNTGAALARYERLLFLDADVRLATDFLSNAVRLLDKTPTAIAGVYMNAQRQALPYFISYQLFNLGIFITQFISPTAIGACIFSTKAVHQQLNGFDESITLCEDCDYVNRAKHYTHFRMLPLTFSFDPRRLRQDGHLRTGIKYLHANLHRFLLGEIRNQKIRYDFGHYK